LSVDVDVSNLNCGIASGLSFREVAADGGISQDQNRSAGPGWGSGNCDGKCSTDHQFIHGLPNVGNTLGACCNEFRLWHGNAFSETMVAHPCVSPGLTVCSAPPGGQCSAPTVCDTTGCEFNPYREGAETFYGPGVAFTIDTTRKFTLVTQFITNASNTLTSIRRFYIQDGKTHSNAFPVTPGITKTNEFTDKHCADQKAVFGEQNVFGCFGGLATLGSAFQRGMVLELSVDEDRVDHMLWLDSDFPPGADPRTPGVSRGLCGSETGDPLDLELHERGAQVIFSNIKFGPIGSTDVLPLTATFAQSNVGFVSCSCPASNGPLAVYIPAALVGSHQCCQAPEIMITYNGKSVPAVFSGILNCDGCSERRDIYLSPFAFQRLADNGGQTVLSGVTWSFM